jgi:hypothetical protein
MRGEKGEDFIFSPFFSLLDGRTKTGSAGFRVYGQAVLTSCVPAPTPPTCSSCALMATRKANKLSKLISSLHQKLPSVLHQPAQTLAFNSQAHTHAPTNTRTHPQSTDSHNTQPKAALSKIVKLFRHSMCKDTTMLQYMMCTIFFML